MKNLMDWGDKDIEGLFEQGTAGCSSISMIREWWP
jgi:hypothetical protein